MRTTEQVHFKWALNGVGGALRILSNLAEDGVQADDESKQHFRETLNEFVALGRRIGALPTPPAGWAGTEMAIESEG